MRVLVCLTVALLAAWPCAAQLAEELADAARPSLKVTDTLSAGVHRARTTLEQQTDLAVTVYNNGRALVRDRRQLSLLPGELTLTFMDVSEQIQPETVSIRSLSDPGRLRILEQNYEYDLMSPEKLMEKYVGQDVKLVNQDQRLYFTTQNAKLLSVNGGPVYQVGDAIYLGHPGTVVLPKVPSELIARPSLVWLLDNDGTDHEVEATYLTGGLSWRADYVLTLNRAEDHMDLEGWVTLHNGSGATYQDAQLKLVAGEVNQVRPQPELMLGVAMARMDKAAAAPPMAEEAFAEYHLYTLQRRTTIKQNQTKQVSLLTASGAAVRKVYEVTGQPHMFWNPFPGEPERSVDVFLVFQNEEESNMGMPLPEGIVRVYQEDSEGMLQFSGEDRIGHTPKDEEVRLRLGSAFDVVAERRQTDYRRLSDRESESEFEVKIRNHKDLDITVEVVEHVGGDWKLLSSTHRHEEKDAFTLVFPVEVKQDGEAVLTYRVRVRH